MLWLVVVVIVIVVVGLWLAGVAERSDARWRPLVRQLAARSAGARELLALVADQHLVLATPLAPAGLPYPVAARLLGRGTLLAMLHQLGAEVADAAAAPGQAPRGTELRARLPLAGVGAPTVRAQVAAFAALADALEALPMAEAMARRFVDLPTETPTHERLQAFEAMVTWHPRAVDVLKACEAEARHGEDATLVAAAKRHLAMITGAALTRSP